MSYGASTSPEYGPDPRPFTRCPVNGCGRRVPQTWNEDEAQLACPRHGHLVPANRPLTGAEIARAFGGPVEPERRLAA